MTNSKILKRKHFEKLYRPLEEELVAMARWVSASGARVVVLFEGRDTAGKGGAIQMVARPLNPRQCHIVALPRPSEAEQGQWYFQRYVQHLPSRGEIVLFDRSWYNRAGVERVMGFASECEVETSLKQVPLFEKQLIEDGILLFKYWLCVDQIEQEKRFAERLRDPLKRWKLSAIDLAARQKYNEYTTARDKMLVATHTDFAPWRLIDSNDQKLGRLTLISDLLSRLPDTDIPPPELTILPLDHEPYRESYRFLEPIQPVATKLQERFAVTAQRATGEVVLLSESSS